MEREIKFRAWDIDISEMLYTEFTGLKDKNGKDIYERDILF